MANGLLLLAFPVQRFNLIVEGLITPSLIVKGFQEVKVNYVNATLPREKTGHDPR